MSGRRKGNLGVTPVSHARELSGREVVDIIMNLAAVSHTQTVSYREFWQSVRPGPIHVDVLTPILLKGVGYCINEQLPIITTLVEPWDMPHLRQRAIHRICNYCEVAGHDTGPDRNAFILEQRERSREYFDICQLTGDARFS